MTSNKDNSIFEKTSFLQGGNSPFIKELYLKYLKDPKSIPQSWIEFFSGLNEDQDVIQKEIQGPSWSPRRSIPNNIVKKDCKLYCKKNAPTPIFRFFILGKQSPVLMLPC